MKDRKLSLRDSTSAADGRKWIAKIINDKVGPSQFTKLCYPVKRRQSIVGSSTMRYRNFLKGCRQFITVHDKLVPLITAVNADNDQPNYVTAQQLGRDCRQYSTPKYFIFISRNPLEFSERLYTLHVCVLRE